LTKESAVLKEPRWSFITVVNPHHTNSISLCILNARINQQVVL